MSWLLAVAAGAVGLSWARTVTQRRSAPDGPAREALNNSLWLHGAGTLLVLALVLGMEPFRLPSSVQWITLGSGVVLTGVGSVKTRQLKAANRRRLEAAGEKADSVIDRVENLEALAALDRGADRRIRLMLLGSKLLMAGSSAWVAAVLHRPVPSLLFGAIATGNAIWAGADVLALVRLRQSRDRLEAEIDALLTGPRVQPVAEHQPRDQALPIPSKEEAG